MAKKILGKKSKLGQFFTVNYEYILKGLYIPEETRKVIEPFTGEKHLLKWITNLFLDIECYDIDPRQPDIIKRDTIMNPPCYQNSFVLTNPPYLARNKSENKDIYNKYQVNDLYKAFLVTLILDPPDGGILIIPLNFFCSIRKADIDIRKKFFDVFEILQLNIFLEKVFEDTSYTVCSFQYQKRTNDKLLLPTIFYPSNKSFFYNLDSSYSIGGEMYDLPLSHYKINRVTSKNKEERNTNLCIKCIDDNVNNKIQLLYIEYNEELEKYIDDTLNQSFRSYASLIVFPSINGDRQKRLVKQFNDFLNEKRDQYESLFLNNYRESKEGFGRKRISFDLVYQIISHLLI